MSGHACLSCGGALKRVFSRRAGTHFWMCAGCGRAFADEGGQPAAMPLRGDPDPAVLCPVCGSAMCLVWGARNGNFWSCSRHPHCKGTREIEEAQP